MEPDISDLARLIGDPARSRMLIALMSGKALTATELSLEADITPQTASSHLSKLVTQDLLVMRKQGRHRYFQLNGYPVAELIETLLSVTASQPNLTKTGPSDPDLRQARVCYDHLGGALGVGIYDSLVARGVLEDRHAITRLTDDGERYFIRLGVDFDAMSRSRRPLCKSCLDWSERRTHLAGGLGQWILNDLLMRGWGQRAPNSRVVHITAPGRKALVERYGIEASLASA
ncbi:ArsR/SmtB family transcription factor [Saccharospirillum salsuginis]|uniref:Transcriptional regulator n=1 Tax=Saccharospirillum salsuginis TaxID=418750 RepID=A0A918N6K9_9GAMM|nr:winged helix-turn-helix domain-containing protein [Saccharospirillum salsuginis]GGX39654.1 transcriptional regulator [Saccharospirillum salsuginis]